MNIERRLDERRRRLTTLLNERRVLIARSLDNDRRLLTLRLEIERLDLEQRQLQLSVETVYRRDSDGHSGDREPDDSIRLSE